MIKAALITEGIPNQRSSGGPLTAWAIMRGLQHHGVEMTAIALPSRNYPYKKDWDIYEKDCRAIGVDVREVQKDVHIHSNSRLARRIIAPRISDVYPHIHYTSQVSEIVKRIKPDILISYHFEGLAAIASLTDIPRIGLVGDPTHLPLLNHFSAQSFQWHFPYFREGVAAFVAQFQHPRFMIAMMNSVDSCGAFAANHAQWFRSAGAAQCEYYRTPMEDKLGPEWREKRDSFAKKSKPKIMLLGHLRGTATSSGLDLFAREVLPRLEKRLGENNFEVHIIGAFQEALSDDLRKRLDRPSIRIRGYVEFIEDEFLSSDVLFVPTPIKLGIRVRIITGFSYGIAVVAHTANSFGIPEMIHRQNSLLGESGESLANALIRIIEDKMLRRNLENASRETFEKFFHAPVAVQKILQKFPTTKPSHSEAERSSALTRLKGATFV